MKFWSFRIFTLITSMTAMTAMSAQASSDKAVDARVSMMFETRNQRGRVPLFLRAPKDFLQTGKAPLLVRFLRPLTMIEKSKYVRLGAEFGKTLLSGAVQVRTTEDALLAMREDGVLKRVSVDLPPKFIHPPLDLSRTETNVNASVAAYRKQEKKLLAGQGVTVGDLDTSVDVFHPSFFYPGNPVAWLDVDGDDVLTPEVDGVDIDGSGTIEDVEVLHLLNGTAVGLFSSSGEAIAGTEDDGYNPGWDYLYLDENGDGKRTVGNQVSGAEQLPALGETVLGAEDLDGDGVIAVAERLVQLDGSKFKSINKDGDIYRRGENLAAFVPVESSDYYDASHATGVQGIIAGGQMGVSRFLGLAPEAELVHAAYGYSSTTGQLQWMVDEGVDVVVTEMGSWGTEPSDGSTETEQFLTAMVDAGVVVVSPAGNLGYSGKHDFATIPASSSATEYQNSFEVVSGYGNPSVIAFSVTWTDGAADVVGSLTLPSAETIDLSVNEGYDVTDAGYGYSIVHDQTDLGAGYLIVYITAPTTFETDTVQFSLKSATEAELHASLFVIDDVSGWYGGANFSDYDVDGCMNSPSFASKALAVSAYALHTGDEWVGYPEDAGEFRMYSGRGPDLWGNAGIAIASPDNPVSASPDDYPTGSNDAEGIAIHWSEFGGTSGAGPHVAGVLALLKQSTGFSGSELRQHLLDSAKSDSWVESGTADQWGAGKLNLDVGSATGDPPSVDVTYEMEGDAITLTASVTDDGDVSQAIVLWDVGYDGTWDSDYSTEWTYALSASTVELPLDVKVEAMDEEGWIAASAIRIASVGAGTGGNDSSTSSAGGGATGSNAEKTEDSGCGCVVAGEVNKRASLHPLWMGLLGIGLLRIGSRRRRNKETRSAWR